MPDDALREIAARTALVLETNNLRGGHDLDLVSSRLLHLIGRFGRQSLSLGALAQMVITHDGLPASVCHEIEALAGRPIDFKRITGATEYYDAKNIGFGRTDPARCEFVVFADADCSPDDGWLAALVSPFADAATQIVAGRTSHAPTIHGIALTTIDFMYFPAPGRTGQTVNFYANNVAFRRSVFERHSYARLDGVHHGQCQVLGLRLARDGVAIHHASDAHTQHRLPSTWREIVKLRWMRGQDTFGVTPDLVRSHAAPWLQWLGRSGPVGPLVVLSCRLFFSLRAVNRQQLPPARGVRRIGVIAAILGITALDMLGAFARGIGIDTFGWKTAAEAFDGHRLLEAEAV